MQNRSIVSFSGITLSEKQREDVQFYMKSVLGEENYCLTKDFFNLVLNSKAKYKILVARKCFNLLNLYYRCHYASWLPEFENSVISDSALFTYIPELSAEYIEWGFFPELLIADDILIHGRAINSLLGSFIEKVYHYLNNKDIHKEYNELESDILKSINIVTIVQNNKPLLMKPAYFQRLFTSGNQFHVWSPVKWHDLSIKIAQLISEGPFSNTSYTLSLYEKENKKVHEYVAEVAHKHDFIKSEWNKKSVRDVWVKSLFNAENDIIAFYTIRITQDTMLNRYCITPFIMLSNYKYNYCNMVYNKVFSQNTIDKLNSMLDLTKATAELFCMVLNYNLFLLLQQDDNRIVISNDLLDIDKMILNFGRESVFGDAMYELTNHKSPFLSWSEMDSLILNGSDKSSSFIEMRNTVWDNINQNISEELEEIIAYEGEGSEKTAYLEYSGQINISEISPREPVSNLFRKINQRIVTYNSHQEIVELVGDFLRQMDFGTVSVGSETSIIGQSAFCSCVYRAGEQSQFIHPKKYADHFPVLLEMEKDCNNDCNEIIKRIDKFYADEPKLLNNLKNYVHFLYSSGQRLCDWDINWLNCTEVDSNTKEMFGNKSQEELLISQMILRSIKQNNELKQYRIMYPQQN